MSRISRRVLTGALMVVIMCSACGRLSFASPTPVWTVPPAGVPVFPTATILASATTTAASATASIPITGEDVVSVQCEFCVDAEAHAVLIFPDFAYFDVNADVPISCFTADVSGGRRILICHGAQSTTFNLNICSDPSNCLHFPVALQPCPVLQTGVTPMATGTAFYLTPINTLEAPFQKPTKKPADTAVPLSTPTSGGVPVTSTSTVIPPTGTMVPTSSAPTPNPQPTSTVTTPAAYTGNTLADSGE